MELSHLYEQTDRKGNIQQLKITVDYDPVERSWTLVKVLAIDCKTRSAVELTNIFFECFHDQAEEIIEGIKWEEMLAENRNSRPAVLPNYVNKREISTYRCMRG